MGSSVTGHQSRIQNLIGDELLIEILSRIPTPTEAIHCKLVCKGWCSLISRPYFITRFKQRHIKHESLYPKPMLGMLSNTVDRVNMAYFENDPDDNNFRDFNLDYLPVKNGNIMVVASCNDLIICKGEHPNYYLCNPFTMQWVALPPPALPATQPSWQSRIVKTGLVCGGKGTIDDPFWYRVVRFNLYGQTRYSVEMYCSETREWITGEDLDRVYWPESKIAGYNGKLHWVGRGGEYFVTYDPFNMRQTSLRLMNRPTTLMSSDPASGYYHVGECEGVLRVVRLELQGWLNSCFDGTMSINDIKVWELQEPGQVSMRLIFKDRIVFNEAYNSSDLDDIQQMGFHPRNKEVLFLVNNDSLTSFNTRTRKLKVESKFKKHSHPYRYAFALQVPWWPTPILNPAPTS